MESASSPSSMSLSHERSLGTSNRSLRLADEREVSLPVVHLADVIEQPNTQTRGQLGAMQLEMHEHFELDPNVHVEARHEPLNRAVNVAIAAIALVLLTPLLLLLALAIRVTSKGPILYSQVRVGVDRRRRRGAASHASPEQRERRVFDLGGKPFTMRKFRTMRTDAEADGRAVWATTDDPRVTPIGRFLRRTRLDELPQFYNVLVGDMNIVGPRPERPAIFAALRSTIPEYQHRQRVKPGITGWAQINQSYDACVDDVRRKVKLDLEYLGRQGMVEDLRIMTLTLPVMIGQRKGW